MENSGRDQETLAEHDLIKPVFVEQEQLYEKPANKKSSVFLKK